LSGWLAPRYAVPSDGVAYTRPGSTLNTGVAFPEWPIAHPATPVASSSPTKAKVTLVLDRSGPVIAANRIRGVVPVGSGSPTIGLSLDLRFCLVAAGAARPAVLLRVSAEPKQKSRRRPRTPGWVPGVRDWGSQDQVGRRRKWRVV